MKIIEFLKNPIKNLRNKYYADLFRSDRFIEIAKTDLRRAIDLRWQAHKGYSFPWDNPVDLNEKIMWLEACTDTTLWTKYSDKYEVRDYLRSLGLEQYLTRCYGVWESTTQIDYNKLPKEFVIKCTHDSGSTHIVRDKANLDINKLNFELDNHMHVIGFPTCEVHYTRIKPRIIAEELLHDNSGISSSLIDYKIWCFNGHPTFCFVCYDRHTGEDNCNHATFDAYSLDNWKTMRHLLSPSMQNQNFKDIPCPFNIDKMIEISKRLSEGFPEVRIDLYNINGRIYFGEMTFTSAGGEMYYFSKQALKDLGHQIILPSIHKKFKVYEHN